MRVAATLLLVLVREAGLRGKGGSAVGWLRDIMRCFVVWAEGGCTGQNDRQGGAARRGLGLTLRHQEGR